ncbi:unnamed protein product [Paramecium sonneborni]|uniref:Transmembrane protein n=1 Tax=Paramecium sonneborni TaxID=65129 RepID=A0A8S1RQ17_9CILI|nr:unnamed protein product [Paramecium sonneborni]
MRVDFCNLNLKVKFSLLFQYPINELTNHRYLKPKQFPLILFFIVLFQYPINGLTYHHYLKLKQFHLVKNMLMTPIHDDHLIWLFIILFQHPKNGLSYHHYQKLTQLQLTILCLNLNINIRNFFIYLIQKQQKLNIDQNSYGSAIVYSIALLSSFLQLYLFLRLLKFFLL